MDVKKYWIHAAVVITGIIIMAIGNLIYQNFSKYCSIWLIIVLIVILAKCLFIKKQRTAK